MWHGVAWCGMVWHGVAWCGMVWHGVAWCGMEWQGVALSAFYEDVIVLVTVCCSSETCIFVWLYEVHKMHPNSRLHGKVAYAASTVNKCELFVDLSSNLYLKSCFQHQSQVWYTLDRRIEDRADLYSLDFEDGR